MGHRHHPSLLAGKALDQCSSQVIIGVATTITSTATREVIRPPMILVEQTEDIKKKMSITHMGTFSFELN